jgi:hypothetical protein
MSPGIRPTIGSGGGTTGSGGGKVRRLGARTGTLRPPRTPNNSGKLNQLRVGEIPILNPRPIGNVSQPRIPYFPFFSPSSINCAIASSST